MKTKKLGLSRFCVFFCLSQKMQIVTNKFHFHRLPHSLNGDAHSKTFTFNLRMLERALMNVEDWMNKIACFCLKYKVRFSQQINDDDTHTFLVSSNLSNKYRYYPS